MTELKVITSQDINNIAKYLLNAVNNLDEGGYGWELTTVGDEIDRLEIARGDIVTDDDIELLKKFDPSLLMSSAIAHSHTVNGVQLTYYYPRIGYDLLDDLAERLNVISDAIREEEGR